MRRRYFRTLVLALVTCAVMALVFASLALGDVRVRYCYQTLAPTTACSNFAYALKYYNENFVNGNTTTGPAIGIYEIDQYGNTAFIVNGRGWVYLTHGDFYARSYCSNRSTTNNWFVTCEYVRRGS